MAVDGTVLASSVVFNQSKYTHVWANHRTLTSLHLLLCWESTYFETGARKVPLKEVLRTKIVHGSCSVESIKKCDYSNSS